MRCLPPNFHDWAIYSLPGATHLPHQDGGGAATLLEGMLGVKVLFIASPMDENTFSSNAELDHDWLTNIDQSTWEAVVIPAGCGL